MLHGTKFNNLLEDLEELDTKQSYKVLLRLKEVPPWDTDAVKEAECHINSLNEAELFTLLNKLRTQFSQEDWETLTGD